MGKRQKLPPLAEPDDGSLDGDAIGMLMRIHKAGGITDANECEFMESLERRSSQPHFPELQPRGADVIIRRGERVWRTPGKAGADLDRPPVCVEIARLEQQYLTSLNKVARTTEMLLRNVEEKNRLAKLRHPDADYHESEVLRFAAEYPEKGRGLSAFIAKRLSLDIRTVQRIRKKAK